LENLIQQFTNELFGSVRVLSINGEPWFVGRDVALVLGYAEPAKAVREHIFEEDKGVSKMDTPGGIQDVIIINESGLYTLILSSKLPSARQFKHWVTSEVLPAMRKIGFTRSMQVLQEENQRLKGLVEGYENSNFMANIDRSEVVDMRNQMIEKVMMSRNIPADEKQFIIQYNPNWNND